MTGDFPDTGNLADKDVAEARQAAEAILVAEFVATASALSDIGLVRIIQILDAERKSRGI